MTANGTTNEFRLKMPWGKFKGVYVDRLNDLYLGWLAVNLDDALTPPRLMKAVQDELVRRQGGNSLNRLPSRWFKRMMKKFPNKPNTIAAGRDMIEELLAKMDEVPEKEPEKAPRKKHKGKAPYGRFSDGAAMPF